MSQTWWEWTEIIKFVWMTWKPRGICGSAEFQRLTEWWRSVQTEKQVVTEFSRSLPTETHSLFLITSLSAGCCSFNESLNWPCISLLGHTDVIIFIVLSGSSSTAAADNSETQTSTFTVYLTVALPPPHCSQVSAAWQMTFIVVLLAALIICSLYRHLLTMYVQHRLRHSWDVV